MSTYLNQIFGNYRLSTFIGLGGFAEVYLGEHIQIKMQAAVKVLYGQMNARDLQTFRQEAQTIANLRHPHIVSLLDFNLQNTIPYLVLDYAPNGSLADRHPNLVPLPPLMIQNYTSQIAKALQFAHQHQFVHRDIKPENILIGRQQELLLSDFGIATMSYNTRQVRLQTVIGTTNYMAPEQITGKATIASDQYALAVMVYEWLTGHNLFEGTAAEILSQHLYANPTPPRSLNNNIPQAVETVILTALAKDPRNRFPQIQDFATALESAFQGKTTIKVSPPIAPAQPIPQPLSPIQSKQAAKNASPQQPEDIIEAFRKKLQKELDSNYAHFLVIAPDNTAGAKASIVEERNWRGSVEKTSLPSYSAIIKHYTINEYSFCAAIIKEIFYDDDFILWIPGSGVRAASAKEGKVVKVNFRDLENNNLFSVPPMTI